MILAALLASATLCVAVPFETKPVYYMAGVHLRDPFWMKACNITPPGWSSMKTAPRDGTVIEIRNAFSRRATHMLMRWTKVDEGLSWWQDALTPTSCKDGVCVSSAGLTENMEPGLAWRTIRQRGDEK